MHIPVYQSISLAMHATAFAALDYSDKLNDLASRITGGWVTRNTLSEAVLQQATSLALSIASTHKAIDKYAQSIAGITCAELIGYTDQILRSADDSQFSASVNELLTRTLDTQAAAGKIPDELKGPALNLAQNLINNYIGKQAVHQLLGAYAHHHDWDKLTDKIQSALVKDGKPTYSNMLISAGVRGGSNFVHNLVKRAIVENPAFQLQGTFQAKPELKLAAGCLHAYLLNDENCTEALANYTPSKALVDESFIHDVTSLTTALAKHHHLSAKETLIQATKVLSEEEARSAAKASESAQAAEDSTAEAANRSGRQSEAQEDGSVLVNDSADDLEKYGFVLIDDSKDEVEKDGLVLINDSTDDIDGEEFVVIARSEEAVDEGKVALTATSKEEVDISDFLLMDSTTKDEADISDFVLVDSKTKTAVNDAKKSLAQAKNMELISEAVGILLVTDPDTRNAQRINDALSVLLKALPTDLHLGSVLANILSKTTALPAQNILGTYVEIYTWDGLEKLLLDAVENNLQRIESTAAEKAEKQFNAQLKADDYATQWAKDDPNTNVALSPPAEQDKSPTDSKERPWIQRAMPKLAIKLAIEHLKPYIDNGDFKHADNREYRALATLLHMNQEALGGTISPTNIVRNAAPVAAQYLADKTVDGVQYLGNAVLYAGSAAQTGAAIALEQIKPVVGQLPAAGGLLGAMLSPATSAVATAGGYVAGIWNSFNPFAAQTDDKPVVAPAVVHAPIPVNESINVLIGGV